MVCPIPSPLQESGIEANRVPNVEFFNLSAQFSGSTLKFPKGGGVILVENLPADSAAAVPPESLHPEAGSLLLHRVEGINYVK